MAEIKPPQVIRPAGRRSPIEEAVTRTLLSNAKTMQDWLVDNNRVATGRAANSLKVKISRQAQPGRTFRKSRKLAKTLGHKESSQAAQLNRDLDKANIGLVTGTITAAPHFVYALQGRGPGKRPPVGEIMKWLQAKGVEPVYSLRDSAYVIARKIGAEGTDEPHFTQQLQTTMVKFSTRKLVESLKGPLGAYFGKTLVQRFLDVADGNVIDAFYKTEGGRQANWKKDLGNIL